MTNFKNLLVTGGCGFIGANFVRYLFEEAGFKGRVAGVVRDDLHAEALGAAGVERVLNPFNDAADYAARSFAAEIAFEDVHRRDAVAPSTPATPVKEPDQ